MDHEDEILERLEKEILPKYISELKRSEDHLRFLSILNFRNTLSNLIYKAFLEYSEVLKIHYAINAREAKFYMLYILNALSVFNGALPSHCPYIVAWLEVKTRKPSGGVAYLERKCIEGLHDVLEKNIAPVIVLENEEEMIKMANGEMKVKIHFGNSSENPA